MRSLNARLLLAATVALAAFLGLTALALDRAFRDSAETALRERLQAQLFGLLAAADLDRNGKLRMPEALPEERYTRPDSGLYALVQRNGGEIEWRSPSLLGQELVFGSEQAAGEGAYRRDTSQRPAFMVYSYGVGWEDRRGRARDYTFSVAESLAGFDAQVQRFRTSLAGWLGAAALVLLAVQGFILRWSLAPLRRVEADLAAIESGAHARLEGEYPKELQGLTGNLNALLASERGQLERYRNGLADLAHSLKTPLAVLRGTLDERKLPDDVTATLAEQVGRMDQIVAYQLQRAATSGRTALMAPTAVQPLLRRLVDSLQKVHADKTVSVQWQIDNEAVFHGDESDFMELAGNLLDNAFKWCRSAVRIELDVLEADKAMHKGLRLCIHDDGPGVPDDKVRDVLRRGVRADSVVSGHGIGLAVVQDIVRAYGGKLSIERSELGGAVVCVVLPPH